MGVAESAPSAPSVTSMKASVAGSGDVGGVTNKVLEAADAANDLARRTEASWEWLQTKAIRSDLSRFLERVGWSAPESSASLQTLRQRVLNVKRSPRHVAAHEGWLNGFVADAARNAARRRADCRAAKMNEAKRSIRISQRREIEWKATAALIRTHSKQVGRADAKQVERVDAFRHKPAASQPQVEGEAPGVGNEVADCTAGELVVVCWLVPHGMTVLCRMRPVDARDDGAGDDDDHTRNDAAVGAADGDLRVKKVRGEPEWFAAKVRPKLYASGITGVSIQHQLEQRKRDRDPAVETAAAVCEGDETAVGAVACTGSAGALGWPAYTPRDHVEWRLPGTRLVMLSGEYRVRWIPSVATPPRMTWTKTVFKAAASFDVGEIYREDDQYRPFQWEGHQLHHPSSLANVFRSRLHVPASMLWRSLSAVCVPWEISMFVMQYAFEDLGPSTCSARVARSSIPSDDLTSKGILPTPPPAAPRAQPRTIVRTFKRVKTIGRAKRPRSPNRPRPSTSPARKQPPRSSQQFPMPHH